MKKKTTAKKFVPKPGNKFWSVASAVVSLSAYKMVYKWKRPSLDNDNDPDWWTYNKFRTHKDALAAAKKIELILKGEL